MEVFFFFFLNIYALYMYLYSFIYPSFHSLYLPGPRSLSVRLGVDLFIRIPAPVLGSGEKGVGWGWGLRGQSC